MNIDCTAGHHVSKKDPMNPENVLRRATKVSSYFSLRKQKEKYNIDE